MIVLFNPWSTPSPKKPLPMSLLAIGSMLEGEFDYCIVDGNVEADPIAKILAVEEKTRNTAVAVTVMPGITPPFTSCTVPLMVAVVCAETKVGTNSRQRTTTR